MMVRPHTLSALLTGALLAVSAAVVAVPARAADLDEPPPYAQDDEDYDAPRVWRQPDPDVPYGRAPPPPPPPRYAERFDNPGCLPRWRIRERLHGQGWVDVHPVSRDGGIVTLEARREDTGRRFFIEIDRCSGAIVDERPVRRQFGMDRRWRGPY